MRKLGRGDNLNRGSKSAHDLEQRGIYVEQHHSLQASFQATLNS